MALARPVAALVCGWAVLSTPAALRSEPTPCATGEMSYVAAARAPEPSSASDHTLTVASLNIAGKGRIAGALSNWMRERSVDVLFLQEVGGEADDGAAFTAALAGRNGVASAYSPARPFESGHAQGLAILSRYPLGEVSVRALPYNRLRFRPRCRIAVAATIRTPSGPVRVVNVHLDTRINQGRRIAQVESALTALDGFDGPRIVGGDFNTTNLAWIDSTWPVPFVQRQGQAVRDRMSAAGFTTPLVGTRATYPILWLGLKLDWLYLSGDLESESAGVDDLPITDHRGVWTHVARRAVSSPGSGPTTAQR